MNSLFKAIYDHFSVTTGSGFYNDVSGRMYLKKAPQEGATFPYCIFFNASDVTDIDFSDEHEDFLTQFSIFSKNNSSLEAGTLLESLKTMFDYADLTVTGYRVLQCKRQNPGRENDDPSQVPPIYGYDVEYNILLERERS